MIAYKGLLLVTWNQITVYKLCSKNQYLNLLLFTKGLLLVIEIIWLLESHETILIEYILFVLDWNTWNLTTACKLFVLRIITQRRNCLQRIIMNY